MSKYYTVTLSNLVNVVAGDIQARGYIVNDDIPKLTITSTQTTRNEGGANIVYTATLSQDGNPSYVNHQNISVNFTFSGVTGDTAPYIATRGTDYSVTNSMPSGVGTLVFADGVNTATITVVPLNEAEGPNINVLDGSEVDEFNERFQINFSSPASSPPVILPAPVTGQVNDNYPEASLTFSIPSNP